MTEIRFADDVITRVILGTPERSTIEAALLELFPRRISLRVRALVPGLSGAVVLLVKPESSAAEHPCVLKLSSERDIDAEIHRYQEYVVPYIRNANLPGVQRYLNGRAIVYQFFPGQTLKDELLKLSGDADEAGVLALLERVLAVLAPWDKDRRSSHLDLINEEYALDQDDFVAFEERCALIGLQGNLVTHRPAGVRELWANPPASLLREQYVGLRHGDLHTNNVLLGENGEVCLIDFALSGEHHYLRDYATLEADLIVNVLVPTGVPIADVWTAIARSFDASSVLDWIDGGQAPTDNETEVLASTMRYIRNRVWARMQGDVDEWSGYFVALIRRLVRMVTSMNNGMPDEVRWLAAEMATTLAHNLAEAEPFDLTPSAVNKQGRLGHQRARSEIAVSEQQFEELLEKLESCRGGVPQYFVVGGVYLDLRVYPVDENELRGIERATLEPVEAHLGGSAYFIAKHLHDVYGIQPTLVSVVGSDSDPLSGLASTLVNAEDWIDELGLAQREAATPVSVHLEDSNRSREATFTHRGALEAFTWADVSRAIKRKPDCPSLICITGYFRTQLHQQLEKHLRTLSDRHVIAFDPGRWISEDAAPTALSALRASIERGYVDLYFCSIDELESLAGTASMSIGRNLRVEERVRRVANTVALPHITVVRQRTWRQGEPIEAYLVMDHQVTPVRPNSAAQGRGDRSHSPKNAFNSAFLHTLISGPGHGSLHDRAVRAVRAGLAAWKQES